MKKKYILFIYFICIGCFMGYAQNLENAKKLYASGAYTEAKPLFQRLVRAQPNNGNYNLWYGICCLKTNDAAIGLKYLQAATKMRVASGQFYLAQAYEDLYKFEEAIDNYENYISELRKRKRPTEEAEKKMEKSRLKLRMLKGVEKVCIVDSVVIDKLHFLEAYKLNKESGRLYMYNDFFQEKKENDATVYETQIGNRIFYAKQQEDGTLGIFSDSKIQGNWSKSLPLPASINGGVNANYPYVLSDGTTIYYAADGENSIGGYDIFVTRYNINTDTYLTPENVGMPFNSPYNDYMFVIDEYSNLGWFASDRFQPEGKVCIYIFVPNTSKQVYDYESSSMEDIVKLAQIHSLKQSWVDFNVVGEAKKRLKAIKTKIAQPAEGNHDFEFIIDDNHVYKSWEDFNSSEAKETFRVYLQLSEALVQQQSNLDRLREKYIKGNNDERKALSPALLDAEQRIEAIYEELQNTAIKVRVTENKTFN